MRLLFCTRHDRIIYICDDSKAVTWSFCFGAARLSIYVFGVCLSDLGFMDNIFRHIGWSVVT